MPLPPHITNPHISLIPTYRFPPHTTSLASRQTKWRTYRPRARWAYQCLCFPNLPRLSVLVEDKNGLFQQIMQNRDCLPAGFVCPCMVTMPSISKWPFGNVLLVGCLFQKQKYVDFHSIFVAVVVILQFLQFFNLILTFFIFLPKSFDNFTSGFYFALFL